MTAKPSISARKPALSSQSLNDWIAQRLASNAQVQVRLRGNILHVLCETSNTLHQAGAMSRLVEALLDEPRGVSVVTEPYPQVYQVYLYNRRVGETKPDWSAPLYLNRLERHRAQYQMQSAESLQIADTQSPEPSLTDQIPVPAWQQDAATTALVLSNMSLARQGDPDAIAWYLSEVLSTLDVGVWVSIRAVPGKTTVHPEVIATQTLVDSGATPSPHGMPRLWILCEAAYSPDPLLIAEPVTERLRKLSLTQFKDAVVVIQVQGEATPDWSLRIDLTPPEEMLREWGRWGDEGAIARLVNNALSPWQVQVTAELKDVSIHLIVQTSVSAGTLAAAPDEGAVIAAIKPLLEKLAPQGVQRAMVYGQKVKATTPAWVHCLDLPASEHLALAEVPEVLAQQGDLPALTYLLTRLLNPDLEAQLATGGTRIKVLRRDQLLHVMADAPICPARRRIVPQILDFLKGLGLKDINGIRLYGRRAGQQRPAWSYGRDFGERQRIVPKAEPSFAASDAYIGDLLTAPEEDALRSDLTSEAVSTAVGQAWKFGWEQLKQLLIRTQLFVPQSDLPRTPPPLPSRDRRSALKVGLVWGLVGVLLALQVDWLLGQILNPATQPAADAAPMPETDDLTNPEAAASGTSQANLPPMEQDREGWDTAEDLTVTDDAAFPEDEELSAGWGQPGDDGFLAEDFTQNPGSGVARSLTGELEASPEQSLAPTPDLLSDSPYPSFRSQQLDEKLALYHERLQSSGPPDVLIIGSSRALRGVDPAALHQELRALGFGELSIFNFGVNGSTAQVVDLTVRRILNTDQLPRLILWADGARAFNSGRTDVTYNAISTSEGYIDLGRRNPDWGGDEADPDAASEASESDVPQSVGDSLKGSYQALDQTLSEQLGRWSAVYADRDRLKTIVRDYVLTPLIAPIMVATSPEDADQNTSDMPIPEGSRIDFDGFLALDVRFNPATYYQLYARVPGIYDSDYENFELQGQQLTAFQRLLDHTQDRDIPVVFVNTPLTDEYLDDYRLAAEEDFQRLMLQLSATESDFVFRDLGQLWTDRYDYFSDPSHLNRYGAYQVSDRLAQDPMIPWPYALDTSVIDPEASP